MQFIESFLRILNTQMPQPGCYGWFHLLWLGITAAATVAACVLGPKTSKKRVKSIVFATAILVAILEIYKQINFSFPVSDSGIRFDFQWYAFPFQFCSTPMYAGLLMGLSKKGRFHDAVSAYLATYAVFAGICVMVYPVSVFTGTIGINIQTMICHGTMLPIGALLYSSGYVKAEQKTFLKALPVFLTAVAMAAVMNELAYYSGLLETETFNMFFISPHCDPSLPVYSLVQQILPFPVCLVIYVGAFSLAAYLLTVIAALLFCRKYANNEGSALTLRSHFAIMQ